MIHKKPHLSSQSRLVQKPHFGAAGALSGQLDRASHLTWRHAVLAQARPTRPQCALRSELPFYTEGHGGQPYLDGADGGPLLLVCQAGPTVGSSSALRPQLRTLLSSAASAESQTLSPRPIWPTLGPQHLGHGRETPPELSLTPLGGLGSSHAAEQGAKARRFRGSAGPDPRGDLGDLRLWDAAPVPSHSHTTDRGSRLNPKDWSAMF